MNHRFVFDLKNPALKALIDHCGDRENWQHFRECYGEKPMMRPCFMLVKDSGAYLMTPFLRQGAPATARLRAPDPGKPGETQLSVVYANGCTPDDEWIGGDDFGEVLPLPEFRLTDTEMVIVVTTKQIRILLS